MLAVIFTLFVLPHLETPRKPESRPATENEVYMTLLSPPTPHPSQNGRIDFQFEAVRILAYRLLHKPSTRDPRRRRFVVLTTEFVPQEQIQILKADGATIHPVKTIRHPTTGTHGEREQQQPHNQFNRLQIWSMTQYSKILYLEPDVLLIRPLSELFNTQFSKDMYNTNYLFATIGDAPPPPKDASSRSLSIVPKADISTNFSSSIFLLRPSIQHALYVNGIYRDPSNTEYLPNMTENSLLQYAYRSNGPYPWAPLTTKLVLQKPGMEDITGSDVVEGQFWQDDSDLDWELRRFWYFAWGEMTGYYLNDRLHGTR